MPRSARVLGTVARRLGVPPRAVWPYALPGMPALLERRWRDRLERAAVLTSEEHAARVGVREIEQPIGCSLCGERRMRALMHTRHPAGRWDYHVVACPSCGLLYRHPGIRPERLGELYAGKYSRFLTGSYAKERRRRYALVMDAFSPLFDDGGGRRLLDFGCGAGLFLELAHERGFDGWGIDLSADAVEHARRRPGGANAYSGAAGDVPEVAAGGFDVVTMWSVLAHLTDPIEDLAMLRRLLKPEGALLLLTVNANSLELKARRSGWNGFTKNHVKFFSPTTLSERHQARLRRAIDAGNRGNMLRAVAFAGASERSAALTA